MMKTKRKIKKIKSYISCDLKIKLFHECIVWTLSLLKSRHEKVNNI